MLQIPVAAQLLRSLAPGPEGGVSQPSSVASNMAPVAATKIGPPAAVGLMFGSNHGLTQMGATGGLVAVIPESLEGLYASAVAEADTVSWVFPQIRAKNVGRVVTCTRTVTVGLVGLVPPKLTVILPLVRGAPPTLFCSAT